MLSGDRIRLLQVIIGGLSSDMGREAARSLVVEGSDRDLQRIALQQIATSGLGANAQLDQYFWIHWMRCCALIRLMHWRRKLFTIELRASFT